MRFNSDTNIFYVGKSSIDTVKICSFVVCSLYLFYVFLSSLLQIMTLETLQHREELDADTQQLLEDPEAFDQFLHGLQELNPDEVSTFTREQAHIDAWYHRQQGGATSWYANEREHVSETSQTLAWAKNKEDMLKRETLAYNRQILDA